MGSARTGNVGPGALKLEAIGEQSIPTLKIGLKSKDPQVRFHSAEALAYLGDSSGLQALFEAARDQYAFRIFALAAMACLDDPEVHVKFRDLMEVESAETRYGAFRALTTLDKNDPFVRGELLNNQFRLHMLKTDGPPDGAHHQLQKGGSGVVRPRSGIEDADLRTCGQQHHRVGFPGCRLRHRHTI